MLADSPEQDTFLTTEALCFPVSAFWFVLKMGSLAYVVHKFTM